MTHFWHPQSNMGHTRDHEVVFTRGEGARLWDAAGREYLDATAALWYCNVGYGRTAIADAVRDQAARLHACSCFDVYASDRTVELADRLAAIAPVDDARVFFTSGGSDSIETAAKVARRYWSAVGAPERTVVISREGSYHGLHSYGTALAGIPANQEGFGPLVADATTVPAMDPAALEARIVELDGRAAAFVAEPVIGAGGVHPPSDGYLAEAAAICRRHDVLLVADEVITGFGRVGSMFACERYGITPDILVGAKGVTSGYMPLGVVFFSGRIAEPFWRREGSEWLRHGYTYSGHATACAAGLANLDIVDAERLVDRVAALEPEFEAALGSLRLHTAISEVRTAGLLAGIQIAAAVREEDPAFADRVIDAARERGVLTRKLAGDALQVSPPFVIGGAEIETIASTLADSLSAAAATRATAVG